MPALRDLYERLLDLPTTERAPWLEVNCADPELRRRVVDMLAARTEREDLLERPAAERLAGLGDDEPAVAPAAWLERKVGAFRVRRLLGEGGMAVVYLGEREGTDFDQQVAVKLLKRGLYSALEQRLFRRERRALAALSHPNIARLVDGGVTDEGVPFLAMEYVDGVPLTRYAIEHQLGVRERLSLLLTVCRAVDAAHRALIVHRDIKPSNILVTADGTAKLLDFGIAKLLDAEAEQTHTGFGALTPEYAAPEQFRGGPITTATDVYALGVLLHELLLGERPDGQPPKRPSSRVVEIAADLWRLPAPQLVLRGVLRGDLDTVILKALEVDPERRYASAGALADELERYLDGRPVLAHPPSAWYRTRKFVQRHRGGVALSAALLLGILASLALALWQGRLAREEARRAATAAAVATTVQDFLLDLFDAAGPAGPRSERPSLDEMLDRAEDRLGAEFADQPAVEAELARKLSSIRYSLGELERAEALAERSARRAELAHGADSLEVGNARYDAGRARYHQGARDEGLAQMEQAYAMVLSHAAGRYDDGTTAADLGYMLASQQQFERGRPLIEHAIEVLGRVCTEEQMAAACRQRVMAQNNLAGAFYAARMLDDALRVARGAAAAAAASWGPEHRQTSIAIGNLAVYEEALGLLADAEAHIRQAIAISERTEAETSPMIGFQRNTLARVYRARGMYLKTAEESERVLEIGLRTLDAESLELATMRANLANALIEIGANERAAELLALALARFEASPQPGQPNVARVRELSARIALADGRLDEALALAAEAVRMRRAQQPTPTLDLTIAAMTHARVLQALGRYDEALAVSDAGLAELANPAYARHPLQVALRARRAEALLALGHVEAARATFAESEALLDAGRNADQLLATRIRLAPPAEQPKLLEAALADLRSRAGERAVLVRELERVRSSP